MLFTVTLDIHSHYRNIVLIIYWENHAKFTPLYNSLANIFLRLEGVTGDKPGQTMEVGHTGHVLFGTWHDIVTTDSTSKIPSPLEIRVQMDT